MRRRKRSPMSSTASTGVAAASALGWVGAWVDAETEHSKAEVLGRSQHAKYALQLAEAASKQNMPVPHTLTPSHPSNSLVAQVLARLLANPARQPPLNLPGRAARQARARSRRQWQPLPGGVSRAKAQKSVGRPSRGASRAATLRACRKRQWVMTCWVVRRTRGGRGGAGQERMLSDITASTVCPVGWCAMSS